MTLPALIDSRGLQDHMGISRRDAEKIMSQVPLVRIKGHRKNFARLADVSSVLTVVREPDKMAVVGSAHVRKRTISTGEKRYDVRYRLASESLKHGGTFKTAQDANARANFIRGELAHGRDPREALKAMRQPKRRSTLDLAFTEFIGSRVDVSAGRTKSYRAARLSLDSLAEYDPEDLTAADIQGWVAECGLARGTIALYLSVLRQVLDYCEVEPNPARSSRVKLPRGRREEVNPPSTKEWETIRASLAKDYVLPFRLMEALGLRVGETVALTWGDVDVANSRFRISKQRTKTGAGQRWLPVPADLMDEIEALTPLEDRRHDRRIFQTTDHRCRNAMSQACKLAGVAHYTPHDLRHRRCSLWLLHGIDPLSATVWSGHSDPSMLMDVYGHVLVSGDDEWREFWVGVYREERLPEEVRVS